LKIGFHVSIYGSVDMAVDRALILGCTTFQIFTRSPRQWNTPELTPQEIQTFKEKIMVSQLTPVFAHMPYLPNLASPRDDVYEKSVEVLTAELNRCSQLKIPYLVTHLGSHVGAGMENGFTRLINGISHALDNAQKGTMLLLENTAGTKNSMGSSFEEIQRIITNLPYPDCVGVCFDTSHAFAAGYDLRTHQTVEDTVNRFDEVIGLEKLKLVHLNDSKGDYNSHVDRHDHIGLGKIGEEGFRNILASKLGKLPLILETPIDARRDDVGNLQKVKELAAGQ
jgi:deoxyribonuclease-4